MTVATTTLTSLPDDILGQITQHCDPQTLYHFRSTCRRANDIGKTEMNIETAAQLVFHHPERYRDLKRNELKENRIIALNALTNQSALFFDPAFPEMFRGDAEMIKTAFVTAFVLHGSKAAEKKFQDFFFILSDIYWELFGWKNCKAKGLPYKLPEPGSEEFGLLPFVYHIFRHERYVLPLTTPDIKKNLGIVLSFLDKYPAQFSLSHIDPSLCDNEKLVRRVVRLNPNEFSHASDRIKDIEDLAWDVIQKKPSLCNRASSRLKDTDKFIWDALLASSNGSPFRCASPRLRNNFILALIAAWKSADLVRYIGPELASSLLGKALQSAPAHFLFQAAHETIDGVSWSYQTLQAICIEIKDIFNRIKTRFCDVWAHSTFMDAVDDLITSGIDFLCSALDNSIEWYKLNGEWILPVALLTLSHFLSLLYGMGLGYLLGKPFCL